MKLFRIGSIITPNRSSKSKEHRYRLDIMVKVGSFLLGVIAGVYMDQSHSMPNVEKWVKLGIRKIKDWEEQTRKS